MLPDPEYRIQEQHASFFHETLRGLRQHIATSIPGHVEVGPARIAKETLLQILDAYAADNEEDGVFAPIVPARHAVAAALIHEVLTAYYAEQVRLADAGHKQLSLWHEYLVEQLRRQGLERDQCLGEARRRSISEAHLEHARRQLLHSYTQQRANASSPLQHFLLDPSLGLSPSTTPLLKPHGYPAHVDVASPNDPASPVGYNARPSYPNAGTPELFRQPQQSHSRLRGDVSFQPSPGSFRGVSRGPYPVTAAAAPPRRTSDSEQSPMREEGLYWSDVSMAAPPRGVQTQGGASRRPCQKAKGSEVETDAASIRNLVRMVSLQDEEIKVLNSVLSEERSKVAQLEERLSSRSPSGSEGEEGLFSAARLTQERERLRVAWIESEKAVMDLRRQLASQRKTAEAAAAKYRREEEGREEEAARRDEEVRQFALAKEALEEEVRMLRERGAEEAIRRKGHDTEREALSRRLGLEQEKVKALLAKQNAQQRQRVMEEGEARGVLEERCRVAEGERDGLVEKIAALKGANEKLERANDELAMELELFKSELEEGRAELGRCVQSAGERMEWRERLRALEEEVSQARVDKQTMGLEKMQLELRVQLLADEREEEARRLREEVESGRERLQRVEEERDAWMTQLERVRHGRNEEGGAGAGAGGVERDEERARMFAEVERLRDIVRELQAGASVQPEGEQVKELELKLKTAERERARHEDALRKWAEKEAKLRLEKDEEMERVRRECETQIEEGQERVEALLRQLGQVEGTVRDKSEEIESLKAAVRAARDEAEEQVRRRLEAEEGGMEVQAEGGAGQEEAAAILERELMQATDLLRCAREEAQALRGQLDRAEGMLGEKGQEVEQMKGKVARLQEEVEKEARRRAEAEEEVEKRRSEGTEVEGLRSRLAQAETLLGRREEERAELERRAEDAERLADGRREEVSRLEEDKRRLTQAVEEEGRRRVRQEEDGRGEGRRLMERVEGLRGELEEAHREGYTKAEEMERIRAQLERAEGQRAEAVARAAMLGERMEELVRHMQERVEAAVRQTASVQAQLGAVTEREGRGRDRVRELEMQLQEALAARTAIERMARDMGRELEGARRESQEAVERTEAAVDAIMSEVSGIRREAEGEGWEERLRGLLNLCLSCKNDVRLGARTRYGREEEEDEEEGGSGAEEGEGQGPWWVREMEVVREEAARLRVEKEAIGEELDTEGQRLRREEHVVAWLAGEVVRLEGALMGHGEEGGAERRRRLQAAIDAVRGGEPEREGSLAASGALQWSPASQGSEQDKTNRARLMDYLSSDGEEDVDVEGALGGGELVRVSERDERRLAVTPGLEEDLRAIEEEEEVSVWTRGVLEDLIAEHQAEKVSIMEGFIHQLECNRREAEEVMEGELRLAAYRARVLLAVQTRMWRRQWRVERQRGAWQRWMAAVRPQEEV